MSGNWKTVRVFISSTFRDMHAERDHLVKVVFPRLRQWCGERRLHLVDIDLRWGVTKDEADNGKALEICLQEIDGSRPFFLCMLGDRYGWVPDELPPEETYRFRGLQAQTHLSITHLEIQHAALVPIARVDGREKLVCQQSFFYFRRPASVPSADAVPDAHRIEHRRTFFESLPERSQMLDELKQSIRSRFAADDRVFDYPATWDAEAENPEDDRLHGRLTSLAEFGRRVEADIQRGIREQFAEHLAALAKPVDPIEEERAQHAAFIENRTRVHVPRLTVEQAVSDYVWGSSERPLVLSGPPGSGKSAILAHWLTQNVGLDQNTWRAKRDDTTLVVARFIGASSASTNLARLLAGICAELRQRLELTEVIEEEVEFGPGQKEKRTRTQSMEVPADPTEVLLKWPKFLAAAGERGRVVVVIDAVNQLDRQADPASAFWIPHRLSQGVRLVVSVLDHGEKSRPEYQPAAGEPADWLRQLRRTKLAFANEKTELPVPELDDASRRQIIHDLPSVFCKTLEPRFVDQLLTNAATRNPLYLLVALEELRVFGSFDKLPQRIAQLPQADDPQRIDEALDAVFGQVLDRLDADVRRQEKQLRALPAEVGLLPTLFCFLASAHEGLSEAELADLLARRFVDLDQEPREGALQFVLRQVRPYLMWKAYPQGLLVDFYHRSFWKAVRNKYLRDPSGRQAIHGELAEYFAAQDWFLEPLEAQRARCKPPYSPRPVHLRKIAELPAQRLALCREATAGESAEELELAYQALEQLFTDLFFLEAKNEAGLTFELPIDFRRVIDLLPRVRAQRRLLKLLDEALRRDLHFINRHHTDYPQALFQCLWNSGWWYDCPEAAEHFDKPHEGPWNQNGEKLHHLLVCWRQQKEKLSLFPWLRAFTPLPFLLGSRIVAVFRGHEAAVSCVTYSQDGQLIASGSFDKTVRLWESGSGRHVRTLEGHTGPVMCVSFSPDGRQVAAASADRTICIWDFNTGHRIRVLEGHTDRVHAVAFLPHGRKLVSAGADRTIRLWDTLAGSSQTTHEVTPALLERVAFSNEGRYVALVWCSDLDLWDIAAGTRLSGIRFPYINADFLSSPKYHQPRPTCAAFSPDGQYVAIGSSERSFLVWNFHSGKQHIVPLPNQNEPTKSRDVSAVRFSIDGSQIAVAANGVIHVWNVPTGVWVDVLRGHGSRISSIAFAPDGRFIASCSEDATVRLWNQASDFLSSFQGLQLQQKWNSGGEVFAGRYGGGANRGGGSLVRNEFVVRSQASDDPIAYWPEAVNDCFLPGHHQRRWNIGLVDYVVTIVLENEG